MFLFLLWRYTEVVKNETQLEFSTERASEALGRTQKASIRRGTTPKDALTNGQMEIIQSFKITSPLVPPSYVESPKPTNLQQSIKTQSEAGPGLSCAAEAILRSLEAPPVLSEAL